MLASSVVNALATLCQDLQVNYRLACSWNMKLDGSLQRNSSTKAVSARKGFQHRSIVVQHVLVMHHPSSCLSPSTTWWFMDSTLGPRCRRGSGRRSRHYLPRRRSPKGGKRGDGPVKSGWRRSASETDSCALRGAVLSRFGSFHANATVVGVRLAQRSQ